MKVTIYTINDAESDYCKQAKDFLTAHNIPFENKDVEHDRSALSEMLVLSDNFSGVPVIVVEEEGAEKKVLKGFTQQEVEQALGLAQPASNAAAQPTDNIQQPTPTETPTVVERPVVEPIAEEKVEPTTQPLDQTISPISPVADVTAPVEPVMPVAPIEPAPIEPVAVETPEPAPVIDNHEDQLKGIMNTLAQTAAAPVADVVAPAAPDWNASADGTPAANVVVPSDSSVEPMQASSAQTVADLPSIPDFPQK